MKRNLKRVPNPSAVDILQMNEEGQMHHLIYDSYEVKYFIARL